MARAAGMLQSGDDDARGAPRQHLIQHGLFTLGQIIRHADDWLQIRIVQDGRNPGHHLGEHHIGQGGDNDADQIDTLTGQSTGNLVRHIAKFPSRRQDPTRGRGETSPRLRKTRLTVISLTPEASDTSRSVKVRFRS